MKSQAHRAGFTIIELVVVITILGILAAFAVPRFAALEVEARSAATQALAGNLRSSAALAHALWLAQSQPATVDIEGATITLANGYPNLATIDNTVSDFSGFTYDATTGVFTKTDAAANCTVTYVEASSSIEAPTITAVVTGC